MTTAVGPSAMSAAVMSDGTARAAALTHDDLVEYRRKHPAWRLLAAENCPLILGFLSATFLEPNVRRMPRPELVDALAAYLYALRERDAGAYPREAEAYVDEWANPATGYLRKSMPLGSDVPVYEPTAAVELAAGFCRGLGPRRFVGTASRLLTIRDLLRQIAVGSDLDPSARIAALERQRAEIDDQLAAIRAGIDTRMEPAAVRERYLQLQDTARALMSDLRAVEESFRSLDRDVRTKATTWEGPRGEFLAEVFGTQQEIGATDQGRSWDAFWEHLLSSAAQEELESLLSAVATLPVLRGYTGEAEQVLRADLFDAAELTQRTVASLSGQLRRFLDDAAWAETRRINRLIRATLASAAQAREAGGDLPEGYVDGLRAEIALPLERPPHTTRPTTRLDSPDDEPDTDADLDVAELLELTHIDLAALRSAVSETLRERGGIASLGEIVTDHPITDGLAELVGYLQVGADLDAYITDSTDEIRWPTDDGWRSAQLPMILFTDDASVTAEASADEGAVHGRLNEDGPTDAA